MVSNGRNWSQMAAHGRKWSRMIANGRNCSQKVDVQTLLLLEKSQLVVSSYNLISLSDAYCHNNDVHNVMLVHATSCPYNDK